MSLHQASQPACEWQHFRCMTPALSLDPCRKEHSGPSNLQMLVAALPLDGAVYALREVWHSLAEVEDRAEPAGPAGSAELAGMGVGAVAEEEAAAVQAPVKGSSIDAPAAPPAEAEGPAEAGQLEAAAEQSRATKPAVPEAAVPEAAMPPEQGAAVADAGAVAAAPTMPAEPPVAGQAAAHEEAAAAAEPMGVAAAETLLRAIGGMPHEQQTPETVGHEAEAAHLAAEPAMLSVPGGSIPAEEEPHPFKPTASTAGPAQAPAAPKAPSTPAAAASGLPPAPAFTSSAAGGMAGQRMAVTVERLGGPPDEGGPRAGKEHSFLGRLLYTG